MSKENQPSVPATAADLQAMYPDLAGQLVTQGRESVDTKQLQEAAAKEEQDRLLGFANAYFGDEAGEKFKAVVSTGVTVEQYKAIVGDSAPGATADQESLDKVKSELLAAIGKAGPENPGGGDGDGGDKDFMAVVEELMATKKIGKTQAMQQVVRTHPQLHQAYVKKVNQAAGA